MFPSDQPFHPADLFTDACYAVQLGYDEALKLVQGAARYFELPTDGILLIEVGDGVFARTRNADWVRSRDTLKGENGQPWARSIGERQWTDLTTRHRAPLRSFGDDRLARWKVGF